MEIEPNIVRQASFQHRGEFIYVTRPTLVFPTCCGEVVPTVQMDDKDSYAYSLRPPLSVGSSSRSAASTRSRCRTSLNSQSTPAPDQALDCCPSILDRRSLASHKTVNARRNKADSVSCVGGCVISEADEVGEEERGHQRRSESAYQL